MLLVVEHHVLQVAPLLTDVCQTSVDEGVALHHQRAWQVQALHEPHRVDGVFLLVRRFAGCARIGALREQKLGHAAQHVESYLQAKRLFHRRLFLLLHKQAALGAEHKQCETV